MAAVRTDAEYAQQLSALLPPGPAWEVEQAAAIHALLAGLAPEFARVDARAGDMIEEADPLTVRELVPDWERVMALPDPCMGATPSFEDRRKAVRARHVAVGGQSIPYFLSIAWGQGYLDATITEHRAPRFGRSRFGRDRFGTWGKQFFWTVNLGRRIEGGRRWGVTQWGERFGMNQNEGIECLLKRYAPAHTIVLFNYEE
ncbi:YmfQ family protein [Cupriavidus sp. 2TAF22]|uniref:YmfQ family protein n=1 Tax=unclassified Cupriavidus TaxID=2640874 RepID=UPI003F920AEB